MNGNVTLAAIILINGNLFAVIAHLLIRFIGKNLLPLNDRLRVI
jgi:hypothetical protein